MKLDEIENAVRGHIPKPIGRHKFYSVLVPLVNKSGEPHLLFEVRAENMRKQPGEICFPGGKMECGETPEQTAVRETCEELCISERSVRVITQLNYLITYSNSTMYASLGEIQEDALLAEPNMNEVKETFLVPLSFFFENEPEICENRVAPIIAEGFPLEKIRFKNGYSWREGRSTVPIYTWKDPAMGSAGEERVIWGLTARIVDNFIGILKGET